MDKIPVIFVKIRYFNKKWEKYLELDKKYKENILNEREIKNFFSLMKMLFTFYFRVIKQEYRINGVSLSYPKEVIKYAGERGLIKDSGTWLDYLKDINILHDAPRECYKENRDIIIKKYHDKFSSMLDYMQSEKKNNIISKYTPIFDEAYKHKPKFPMNDPVYSPDEIGITPRSYKILIDFFRSNSNIRNVWFHGSRMYGTGTPGSDIDIVIDCPPLEYNRIKKRLNCLLMPYNIDSKNLYMRSHRRFITDVTLLGSKRIYCASNLNTYWDRPIPRVLKSKVKIWKIIT